MHLRVNGKGGHQRRISTQKIADVGDAMSNGKIAIGGHIDRSIKQALTTQAPVALILSPLLTGGKTFDK